MEKFNEIFEKVINKTIANIDIIGADFPKTAHGKDYEITDEIHDWTNGFWPGLLWIAYLSGKSQKAKEVALKCEERLDEALHDYFVRLGHDVGFVWLLASYINYAETKDIKSRDRVYAAATVLASRFNSKGGYIRSWNDIPGKDTKRWSIADNMMNLPLLYHASEITGDPRFAHVATAHATTMSKYLMREDGSSNHIICFNPETGENEENSETLEYTQGYSTTSAWTRGQAWVLSGFTYCYGHTKKPEFLEAAKKSARFFLSQLDDSYVVPIDFFAPDKDATDSSAAAIAASGMLELCKYLDGEEKEFFLSGAKNILLMLDRKFADYTSATQPILSGGATRYFGEGMRDVSLIYGDFYYAEALYKLTGGKTLFA